MRSLILTGLTFLLFTNVNAEELTAKHKSLCSTSKIKSLVGKKGSCQVSIIPLPTKIAAYTCTATTSENLFCRFEVSIEPDSGKINVLCNKQDGVATEPEAEFSLNLSSLVYTAHALVKDKRGRSYLFSSPDIYKVLEGPVITIELEEPEDNLFPPKATINFAGMDFIHTECSYF